MSELFTTTFPGFRHLVQYGLESSSRAVLKEALISIPILFPPDFDSRYGSKVIILSVLILKGKSHEN
jgi:hypothetical protein